MSCTTTISFSFDKLMVEGQVSLCCLSGQQDRSLFSLYESKASSVFKNSLFKAPSVYGNHYVYHDSDDALKCSYT